MKLDRFVRPLSALALLLGLSLTALAQQEVCLSVDGGPATGSNGSGGPSSLSARLHVNGADDTTGVAPAAGQTNAQVSAAHQAAFNAKGYTTRRVAPNKFCITAGPGGAPITEGVAYGNDDTGLDIDSGVKRLAPPPGPGVPTVDPKTKDGGGGIGLPPVNQPPVPLPQPAQLVIIIEVRRADGSVVVIVVQVLIFPGMNGLQIQQAIEQALRAAGLLPNRVRWPSALRGNQLIDGFQVDRTVDGSQVEHMEYRYDGLSRRVVRAQEMTAGMFPSFGATDYGTPTTGAAGSRPWAFAQGEPALDSFFDVFYKVELPFAPGGELLSLSRNLPALPLLNGHVLVDLHTAAFTFAMTGPDGAMRRSYYVPNSGALIGLPLNAQGLALDLQSNQLSMTNGIAIVIGS